MSDDEYPFDHPKGIKDDELCRCAGCLGRIKVERNTREQYLFLLGVDAAKQRLKADEIARRGPLEGRVLTYSQLKALPRPDPLILDVLYTGAVAVILGNSQVGKTWVTLAIECCAATGKPWPHTAGELTTACQPSFPVLYIAAESSGSIASRVECWEQAHGVDLEQYPFDTYPDALDLLSDPQIEELAELIKVKRYRLVVVDTVAASLAGAEETNETFSKVVRNMRVLTAAMDAHGGGSVVLVHHFGKDASRGARGGSSLFNDSDIVWELSGDIKNIEMTCRKWKIDDLRPTIRLTLDTSDSTRTHIRALDHDAAIDMVPANNHSRLRMEAVSFVTDHGHLNEGLGPSTNEILAGFKDKDITFKKTDAIDAINSLDMDGTFLVKEGRRGAKHHSVPTRSRPDPEPFD